MRPTHPLTGGRQRVATHPPTLGGGSPPQKCPCLSGIPEVVDCGDAAEIDGLGEIADLDDIAEIGDLGKIADPGGL